MKYPQLNITGRSLVSIRRFPGYDHRLKASAGTMFEAENLSLSRYPMLSTRAKRGEGFIQNPQGMIAKDALCTVSDGTLYVNGLPTPIEGMAEGEKQLVSMGAYILIFPDKLYYNTADPSDYGSMEAEFEYSGVLSYAMCDSRGNELSDIAAAQPEEPENGQLWLSAGELMEYSAASAMWVRHETVYTRLTFSTMGELPRLFKELDGVEIEGAELSDLNGSKIIYAMGGSETEADFIVLVGLCENPFTREDAELSIRRRLPDMDFVCQCRNRLWGCRYGNDGEQNINELYCSALGDFKNFSQFLGLSTDSWRASLGSDGVFTGAVSYMDSPCFFKEDRIHRVTVSPIGAHHVSETACRGVQKGSHKSLCVVGESLFYKSEPYVCQWQGGFPAVVSAPLGTVRYHSAVAGSSGSLYYISMLDENCSPQLFVYDSALGLWQREDGTDALCFAAISDRLYCLEKSGKLLELSGKDSRLEKEADITWYAQTGVQDFDAGDKKYLSRYTLSLGMEEGAEVSMFIRYDSEADWHSAGSFKSLRRGAVLLPVRPRRCQHLELRLEGRGDVTLYALDAWYEKGSDI